MTSSDLKNPAGPDCQIDCMHSWLLNQRKVSGPGHGHNHYFDSKDESVLSRNHISKMKSIKKAETRHFGKLTVAASLLLVTFRSVKGFAPPARTRTTHVPRFASQKSESGSSGPVDDDIGIDRRSALTTAATSGLAFAASALILPNPLEPSSFAASAAPATSTKIPEWTLKQGIKKGSRVAFPTLALNTVGLSLEDTTRAVKLAHDAGIRHVDFHPGPKERDGVAAYIRQYGRSDLFLNTKIRKAQPGTSAADAAERTRTQIAEDLAALGVDGVDMLMLRDSPDCDVIQAQWAVLEEALMTGKTRSIGVINFCESALKCVLETAKVKPALNYYMLHVGMGTDPRGLRSFGESRGIKTFAYGAVGEPGPNEELLNIPVLKRIGEVHGGRAPEEVALRWVLQSGAACSVRPTTDFGLGVSTCEEGSKCENGILARSGSFGWSLTEQEMKELDEMTSPNDNPTLFSSAGCPDAFVMPKK